MKDVLHLIERYTHPRIAAALIKPDDNFMELGIDSLNFLLLLLDMESQSNGFKLDPKMVAKLRTVQDLVNLAKSWQVST